MNTLIQTPKIIVNLEIQPDDIDVNHHVNNVVYVRWMQLGQRAFFEACGWPLARLKAHNLMPIIADTHVSYKKQLRPDDAVAMEVWLSELKKSYAWVEFRFYNHDRETVATGRQRGTFINTTSQKLHKLTDEQLTSMTQFLIPAI
jgi:acyl-CoA thioester hydrolase